MSAGVVAEDLNLQAGSRESHRTARTNDQHPTFYPCELRMESTLSSRSEVPMGYGAYQTMPSARPTGNKKYFSRNKSMVLVLCQQWKFSTKVQRLGYKAGETPTTGLPMPHTMSVQGCFTAWCTRQTKCWGQPDTARAPVTNYWLAGSSLNSLSGNRRACSYLWCAGPMWGILREWFPYSVKCGMANRLGSNGKCSKIRHLMSKVGDIISLFWKATKGRPRCIEVENGTWGQRVTEGHP